MNHMTKMKNNDRIKTEMEEEMKFGKNTKTFIIATIVFYSTCKQLFYQLGS